VSGGLLRGELVRLEAVDPAAHAAYFARWSADSAYERLLDAEPARPRSAAEAKAELEKLLEGTEDYLFLVRALEGDVPIGMVELDDIAWARGDAWIGIGLGERGYWGKGYGTDALRTLLRFAFDELNLHRVTLNLFSYNTRALRMYTGLGFTVEGAAREAVVREGRRWDLIFMGLLRREWEATTPAR
jgi:RimJ/RimL family protein N-acetyltransferase